MKKIKNITVCSFFTGAGGLDLGLEGGFTYLGKEIPKTNLETVFACDILKPAKIAFDKHWSFRGGARITDASIVDLVKRNPKEKVLPLADIVTGGFPCQDFSLAGKRGGFISHKDHKGDRIFGAPEGNEGRGMLYYWLVKTVEEIQPKMFIAENVKGLLSVEGALERIKADFSNLGYTVQVKLLFAPDYGVPQTRERVIFLGVRNASVKDKSTLKKIATGEIELHPKPTHAKGGAGGLIPYVTTKEALAGLVEPDKSTDPSQQAYSKAAFLHKGQGQKEVNMDGQAPTIRAEHHGNIEFRRLSKVHGGKIDKELNKGLPERRLSVRECARIQTFPDDYEFVQKGLGGSPAYKIIGNAVPPLLGYALATRIKELWPVLFDEKIE